MNEPRIECWIPAIIEAVRARYIANAATAKKATEEATRLLRYLNSVARTWDRVVMEMVSNWCCTARPNAMGEYRQVAPNTASNRAWAARSVLEAAQALGANVEAASLLCEMPRRQTSESAMRPLTADETRLVRASAKGGMITTDLPLLVALSGAGATASEIATITAGHIDPVRGFVRLPGAKGIAERVNPFDDWGQIEVRFQLRNRSGLCASAPLCVTAGLSLDRAKHSVTVRLRRVLEDAGIAHRPGVVARSIRYTTAHRIAHAHGIIAAANFLGVDSVDDVIKVFRRALPEGGSDG
ncbi:hypothetical protein [Candidatus Poriferisodalis sp.]|uniref:hypothetical protein n=1 Tax=Candidatus Poriferisodalis sp. TaxID=3101277 RepID=UPI003B01B6E1